MVQTHWKKSLHQASCQRNLKFSPFCMQTMRRNSNRINIVLLPQNVLVRNLSTFPKVTEAWILCNFSRHSSMEFLEHHIKLYHLLLKQFYLQSHKDFNSCINVWTYLTIFLTSFWWRTVLFIDGQVDSCVQFNI